MIKKNKILLILILVLGFVLRFYKLDSYPALNADEAAIGYNAYSLILTGKDEHGNAFPVHFQSFNDYKPGLYFYVVLPFVASLGLNTLAVRIPGALAGVASIYLLYLLIYELKIPKKPKYFSLLSAFFLAISPWHIHFSRGGWEVNFATFLIILGVLLFYLSKKKTMLIYFSFIFFCLSFYTYHSARIVVPLLILSLIFFERKFVFANIKKFVISFLISFLFCLPLILDIFTGSVFSRAAGVGLFADPGPLSRINEQRGEHEDYVRIDAKILHNKATNYSLAFLSNWSKHYWGEFLFLSGETIQRNRVPEMGQLYLIDFIFIIIGFIGVVRHRKGFGFWLFWLLIAPIASALTFQSPHALRAQNMVIPLIVFSSFGASLVLDRVLAFRFNLKLFTLFFLISLIVWSFVRYQLMYWVHMAREYPYSSQYGVSELVDYVSSVYDDYDKIVVTNRYDQPYILFLFYLRYPPNQFQKEHVLTQRDEFGFSTVDSFDKFVFKDIDFDSDRPRFSNSLIVGTDEDIHKVANIVKKIYGQNGFLYFDAVAN